MNAASTSFDARGRRTDAGLGRWRNRLEGVMHGPAWSRTLLIWLYDEHGGFTRLPEPALRRGSRGSPRRRRAMATGR